ncbi:hypothetical protein Tco_0666488 [Tanacetum coccineum]
MNKEDTLAMAATAIGRHAKINGHWWWDWRRDVRGGSEYQQLQMLTQAVSHVALREGQDRLWWDIYIEEESEHIYVASKIKQAANTI